MTSKSGANRALDALHGGKMNAQCSALPMTCRAAHGHTHMHVLCSLMYVQVCTRAWHAPRILCGS
jgi:hypothetical protein